MLCGSRLHGLRKTSKIVIPSAGFARGICFFPRFAKKQILRFAQDDNQSHLFRSLFIRDTKLL
jgi:hypothetical protein